MWLRGATLVVQGRLVLFRFARVVISSLSAFACLLACFRFCPSPACFQIGLGVLLAFFGSLVVPVLVPKYSNTFICVRAVFGSWAFLFGSIWSPVGTFWAHMGFVLDRCWPVLSVSGPPVAPFLAQKYS